MTYKDLSSLTDPLEAIRSLFAEMTSVKEELSAAKSDVANLNRNNTRQLVIIKGLQTEVASLKQENEELKTEIERLGGTKVEKDSTNSSIPPTKQPLPKQIEQHTKSLRKSSGKKPGGRRDMRDIPLEERNTLCNGRAQSKNLPPLRSSDSRRRSANMYENRTDNRHHRSDATLQYYRA